MILHKDFQKGYAEALNDTAKWLEKNLLNYWQQSITDPSEFIDRFRKEMKEQL